MEKSEEKRFWGRGKIPPLALLSSCGWTHNKLNPRQTNRRKRNKFNLWAWRFPIKEAKKW